MEWPSLSPDLNPMENMWAKMVKKMYTGGKQYVNTAELKKAILEAWNEISFDEIVDLIETMSKRVYKVIRNPGKLTNY